MTAVDTVIGWDVGGAHLKAARVERGLLTDVMQVPCTLWKGIEAIDAALASVHACWPQAREARHGVTMTGEMADLFPDREAGVVALVERLAHGLGGRAVFFAESAWLNPAQAMFEWARVASANWLATAAWIAQRIDSALLLDIGSTTTDIVPIRNGAVAAVGRSDAARLATGELVYQGVVRTPLCALLQRVHFRAAECNVMNEWFATSADVYRLTEELDPGHDQHDTADHRGKDRVSTCARLARMIGRDARDARDAEWLELARTFRSAQLQLIERSLAQVSSAARLPVDAPVVAAGCGDFLARELADRLARPCFGFDALLGMSGARARWARVCAPSAAVALLLARQHQGVDPRLACGS